MTRAKIYIDGEAGTTGLQIRDRLAARDDIDLLAIDPAKRKDMDERRRLLNEADVAILCLPDDAARESVSLIDNDRTAVIDASTAHRVAPDWAYGFAEMTKGQAEAIANSKRVANPGCWPQGLIAGIRPLIDAGLMPADAPLTYNGVSGYSGGGRKMVEDYVSAADPSPFMPYGLTFKHKHLPEMSAYTGLVRAPQFQPAVGNFAQGMLTFVPLRLWSVAPGLTAKAIHEVLADRYAGETFVKVMPFEPAERLASLDPRALNGTNELRLHVFADAAGDEALIVSLYDNLGKGASGAAVQNLNLMLGRPAATGLVPA
ncbi:N-acetyl-gamma-glutamyl-phosphate reductase [Pleomorphomonas sp. NRK KF1]|uniref:N-acetyl-gamma-glutamyl-phosphate reductase n=1 Tax=Pleomorphomonas sp. NRK KF1 TaxID=2943000 RepID=UPI00204377EE|nr:N-acetyl-gamma-glutamyl-phosphate reductase [Pleomorphomonas sp. NRK KF1]MCM5554222.1 N-acetyl-gamma-glutamyl-phosphate reductase [Pleomorphomonas sp. NRK KF1]